MRKSRIEFLKRQGERRRVQTCFWDDVIGLIDHIEGLEAEIEKMAAATGIPRQWKNGKREIIMRENEGND